MKKKLLLTLALLPLLTGCNTGYVDISVSEESNIIAPILNKYDVISYKIEEYKNVKRTEYLVYSVEFIANGFKNEDPWATPQYTNLVCIYNIKDLKYTYKFIDGNNVEYDIIL